MTGLLVQAIVWLNAAANLLGRILLAPIGVLPGWLSATIVAAVTGVLLLLVFKYTSNQRAIKRVRDDINANLLALKLFKDSAAVTLRAQGRMIAGGLQLMVLALVPMLVMAVPVLLLLGQLSLWYQSRPLRVGEDAVIRLKLNGERSASLPVVQLRPPAAAEVEVGPVSVRSKREILWRVKARQSGVHQLHFEVDGETSHKELVVGVGFERVSARRPSWQWWDILLNPAEQPFPPGYPVRSIAIDYPERSSWTSGTDSWVIYWFAVSMIAALASRRVVGVHV